MPASALRPSSSTAKDGNSRKSEIRRIAAEMFAARGYHATGIAELGAAVGLGKGALYYHIGSKEQLLYEIFTDHVVLMVAYGEEVVATDGSPVDKFRQVSRRLMQVISDNKAELTLFFREWQVLTGDRLQVVLDLRHRFEAIWSSIIDEGVKAGVFRPGDAIRIKGVLGLHNYSYLWLDPKGRLNAAEISDAFCDLLLNGLLS